MRHLRRRRNRRGQSLVEFAMVCAAVTVVAMPVINVMRRKTQDMFLSEVYAVTSPGPSSNSGGNANGESCPDGPTNPVDVMPL